MWHSGLKGIRSVKSISRWRGFDDVYEGKQWKKLTVAVQVLDQGLGAS